MTNWKYTDVGNSVVLRTLENGGTESCLVSAIAGWLAAGNVPEPYVQPEPAKVLTVTMKQARLALWELGHLDAVTAGIASMGREAQIIWEFAATVERDDALTEALANALELTDEQVNALFTTAAAL